MAISDYISSSDEKTQLNNDIFSCFQRLCLMLRVLSSTIDLNSTLRVRLLSCQCTARATKIVRSIGFNCAVSHTILRPNGNQILNMAASLYSLALSLVIIRQSCGEGSYSVSMLLWSACESLSCVIDIMPRAKDDRAENILLHHGKSSRTLIFDTLRLTAPSPNDLYIEIHKMQNSKRSVIILDELRSKKENQNDQNSFISCGIADSGNRGSGRSRDRCDNICKDDDADHSAESSGRRIGTGTGTGTRTSPGDMKSLGGAESYKLEYLLDGLQMMLRAGILDDKKQKQRYVTE